jgi:signal transduction histidine kinase
MIPLVRPWLLVTGTLLGFGGLGYGSMLRQGGEDMVGHLLWESVSNLRQADAVYFLSRQGDQGRAEADTVLAQWGDVLASPVARQIVAATRLCVRSPACGEDVGTVSGLRDYFLAGMQAGWDELQGLRSRSLWFTAWGAALIGLTFGAALDWVWRRRDARRGAEIQQLSRRLQEAQVHEYERERFAQVGEVAGALAHDLKNPLALLRATAQVIQQRPSKDGGDLLPILAQIDAIGDTINGLMAALSEDMCAPEPTPPGELIAAVASHLDPHAEARGVHVQTAWVVEEPKVLVQRETACLALQALLGNAVDAAQRGGTVQLATARADGRSHIVIRNDAGSIPAGVADGRRIGTQKLGGSGLGVALARRLVERQGGQIDFPVDDLGAVYVTFPAATA